MVKGFQKNTVSTTQATNSKKSILFIIALVVIVSAVVIVPGIVYGYVRTAPYREKSEYVLQHGTETTAISTGEVGRSRYLYNGARGAHIQYYALYEYKTPDGATHTIRGGVGYNIPGDIKQGKKAIVRYAQNGGEFQDIIISEQYHSTDTNPKFRDFK